MRKYWLTIALFIAFVALLAFVFINHNKPVEVKRTNLLIETDKSKIASIYLVSSKILEFQNNSGNYQMLIPEEVPFVKSRVDQLFDKASRLEYDSIISQKETDLEQFGLAKPQRIIRINSLDGTTRAIKVGSLNPAQDAYFVKEEGKDTIYKVDAEVLAIFMQDAESFVDKKLITFDKNKVDKILVFFDEKPKMFEKRNDVWETGGIQLKRNKTNEMIDRFLGSEASGLANKDKYINTSSQPEFRIVFYENNVETQNVALYKNNDSYSMIKEGIASVQYYVSKDNFDKFKDSIIKLYQDAVLK